MNDMNDIDNITMLNNVINNDDILIDEEPNYNFELGENEYKNYTELFNNAIEVVSNSYNLDDNDKIKNIEFIENIWLEENSGLDSKELSESITNIYIYYPETEQEYNFYYKSINHIMENFRIPSVAKKRTSYLISSIFYESEYEIIDKKWDFNFYIYTNDFIYYSNGLRNDHGKYFNIIPRISKQVFF